MKRMPLWKRRRWSVARLVALLAGVKKVTSFETLKKRYGVSTRDIVALERRLLEASADGTPILSLESSYQLTAKANIPAELQEMARLDISETLWALRALAATYGGPKYDKALKSIAAQLTKGKWKGDYERFGRFYPDQSPPLLTSEGRFVIDALQEKKLLNFHYKDSELTQRTVKPLSFRRGKNRWRLLAWDIHREGWRVFRLENMKDIKVSKETFGWPPRMDLNKLKNMDLSVYRPNGEEIQVKIKIRNPAWEKYRNIFPLSHPPANGWVTLTMLSNSPEWVARYFLPVLGDVKILEPIEYKKAWQDEIKAVKAIYR